MARDKKTIFAFADDIVVISDTRKQLEETIDICNKALIK